MLFKESRPYGHGPLAHRAMGIVVVGVRRRRRRRHRLVVVIVVSTNDRKIHPEAYPSPFQALSKPCPSPLVFVQAP